MAVQNGLFAELRGNPGRRMPEGFRHEENFITEAEEAELLESLAALDLKPFEFHGHLGRRRVTSFGLRYDFSRRTVETADQVPAFLYSLVVRVAEYANRDVSDFRQCGINEYPPGAGIGWHKDKPQFGVIISVSLRAPATLRLRRAHEDGWLRVTQVLNPRSIYILDGEARTVWEHSIPPVSASRYSLTFRTLVR